jgi:Cytochrome c
VKISRANLCLAFCQMLLIGVSMAQQVQDAKPDTEAARLKAQLAIGLKLYREGVAGSGEPLTAIGAAQTVLRGKAVACVACHRRSGFGTTEGQFTIRPVTGTALFEEQTPPVRSERIKSRLGTRQRPIYTEELLARALRSGTDASGKVLDSVMPRYDLSRDDLKAISAYLATLSTQFSPGVDDEEIHFATVIQPGVSGESRSAMLDVMQAFFADKGANIRSDEQRRDAGNMRMYRSYRKWILHVWELSGSKETWAAQLEAYYRQRPVFALIGGLGVESWLPIHEFSERFELPSVLSQVKLPGLSNSNNYNFYFSRGLSLEAEVLAKFLQDQKDPGFVVQVYRRDEAGLTASAAFRKAMAPDTPIEDIVLDGTIDQAAFGRISSAKPSALIFWLGEKDLSAMQGWGASLSVPVYLSFEQLAGKFPAALAALGGNLRLIYPSDLPPRHDARLSRTKIWLHNKGLPISDEVIQVNTQFALTVISDAVGHIMDSFSRDYFVERIEHAVSQTPIPSAYQSVSLGPGQRFAAKGSSLVQVIGGDKVQFKQLSGWIVP